MIGLTKREKTRRDERVYRVENLNPDKNIFCSLSISKDKKRSTVCLCLAEKTVKTTFPSVSQGYEQLAKYRSLYKKIN